MDSGFKMRGPEGPGEVDNDGLDGDLFLDGVPEDAFAFNKALRDTSAQDTTDGDGEEVDEAATGAQVAPPIDEGDFLDPRQHELFVRLKRRVRDACNVNSRHALRARALEWLFVPNHEDAEHLTFDLTCLSLGARPVVVRARIAYQLWKGSIILNEPLPFLTAMPPLLSEISAKVGPGMPEDVAREVWFWPSMPLSTLHAKLASRAEKAYRAAINDLISSGYIAVSAARAYFISRNPALLPQVVRNRFSFARSIHED